MQARGETGRGRGRRRWAVRASVALAVCMVTAACGHRLSREELLAANPGDAQAVANASDDTATAAAQGDGAAVGTDPSGTATSPSGGTTSGGPTAASGGAARRQTGGDAAAISSGDRSPIVIGAVGTFSGPAGALGTPFLHGVQAWVAASNRQGGLGGRRLQYIVVDDGADPARHVAALRDLTETKKVVAFVGEFAPFTIRSGETYLKQAGMPVVGVFCESDPAEEHNPPFFTTCGPHKDELIGIARNAVRFQAGRKLAVVYCSEAQVCRDNYDVLVQQGGAKQAGLNVVYTAQVSLAQPDFTSECISARNAGADVFFPATDPSGAVRVAASCARQGYRPQFIFGANATADLRTKTGLENVIIAVTTFPFVGIDTPAFNEFKRGWDAAGQGEAGPGPSMGWAAGKMFELVVSKATKAGLPITPKNVIATLQTFRGETLGGLTVPLTFTPDGKFQNPPCWWGLQGGKDSWTALDAGTMQCP